MVVATAKEGCIASALSRPGSGFIAQEVLLQAHACTAFKHAPPLPGLQVFGKPRAEWKAQPAWRQQMAKKQCGLW